MPLALGDSAAATEGPTAGRLVELRTEPPSEWQDLAVERWVPCTRLPDVNFLH